MTSDPIVSNLSKDDGLFWKELTCAPVIRRATRQVQQAIQSTRIGLVLRWCWRHVSRLDDDLRLVHLSVRAFSTISAYRSCNPLLQNSLASLFSRLLMFSNLVGFAYPFYATISAIYAPSADNNLKPWLSYWIVYGTLPLLIKLLFLASFVPYLSFVRLGIFLACMNNQVNPCYLQLHIPPLSVQILWPF